MVSCFLSLGSNIGDRLSNINTAISHINTLRENSVISESNVYESDAMYNEDLEKFYNCVIKMKTELYTSQLLAFLKNIENAKKSTPNKVEYKSSTNLEKEKKTEKKEVKKKTEKSKLN